MTPIRFAMFTVLLITLTACGDAGNKTPSTGDPAPAGAASLPDGLIVASKIENARTIAELKKDAKEGDEVILRGVVGGDVDPFVANRAMVSVIDHAVVSCKDNGEECPTPWDYCCTPQDELTKARATIQVVGDDGQPLRIAMNTGQKIKPYDVIIVRGKVGPRPAADVLIINATAIHVEGAKN